jgi:hypothetical protein
VDAVLAVRLACVRAVLALRLAAFRFRVVAAFFARALR